MLRLGRLSFLALGAASLGVAGAVARTEPAEAQGRKVEFGKDVRPLLQKYCTGCHSGAQPPAGLDFSKAKTDADVQRADRDWERVVRALENAHMPPATAPQPSQEQREGMVAAIQSILTGNCTVQDAGRVTIRRLNRVEYTNTIRDLIGIEFDGAEDFPSDDVGYGFDNIGDVLTMSPLLLEKYLDAAEEITAEAIVLDGKKRFSFGPEKMRSGPGMGIGPGGALTMSTNGAATIEHRFPADGEYTISATAAGNAVNGVPARMRISLDGQEVQAFDLVPKPTAYTATVKVARGRHRIGVEFLNDLYQPNDPNPANRDRNMAVRDVTVDGPLDGSATFPETERIIPRAPQPGKEVEAAREYLQAFAARAYRRPPKPQEVEALVRVFKVPFGNKESFNRSMQVAVSAALVSPQFLFRVELDPKPDDPKASRLLSGYEIASRLSYFLWSTMPDEELLKLAAAGKLNEPKAIEAQVDRMLKDPKAAMLGRTFADQWLQLSKLASIRPDPKKFPNFLPTTRGLLLAQPRLFFDDVVANDRSVIEFLDSRHTILNNQLAAYYDIGGVEGPQMRRVEIDKPERGGVLGMGAVLMLTSNPTRTSPTKRGRWVLEQILGTPPPPPPPGADVLKPKPAGSPVATLRQQMQEHRSNPECASCHDRMDPLGFGMENFNAIGQWRYRDDEDAQVDATGVLPDGSKFNGPVELRGVLLAKKDQFVRAFAEKLMIFGLGRGATLRDDCALDDIAKRCKENGYKFSAIIKGIATSEPFRKRRTGD